MTRLLTALLLCVLALRALATPTDVPAPSPAAIDDAVDKLKDRLYHLQNGDGHWEVGPAPERGMPPSNAFRSQWGGRTALAVYALLVAGDNPQSPKLAPAIKWLKTNQPFGTYTLAMRCQVWANLPQTTEIRQLLRRDATSLLQGVIPGNGEASGMYDYFPYGQFNLGGRPAYASYSHSRAQYGVLGVWTASEMGAIEVPNSYWALVQKSWIGHQDKRGGWGYVDEHQFDASSATPGLTAAGVATLFITSEYLSNSAGANCTPPPATPALDKGVAWLVDNYNKVIDPEGYHALRLNPGPTLYTIERAAAASGLKYFGTVDWYALGADFILRTHRAIDVAARDAANDDGMTSAGSLVDTAFCILFLVRGRSPVAVNKLQYFKETEAKPNAKAHASPAAPTPGTFTTAGAAWNIRPRDAANLTHFIGRETERFLNWQVVNLDVSTDELHDAPILYIEGASALTFTPEQEQKLRTFAEEGGLILANADCGNEAFSQSFKDLGKRLFPDEAFRNLPADHPILSAEAYDRRNWKNPPTILGLSNGCRELMILLPTGDPARYWQTRAVAGREEFHQLALDIYLYAIDKANVSRRGETYIVRPGRAASTQPARPIKLARLQYPGNWNPEPYGWQRLTAVLRNENNVNLSVEAVPLGQHKLGFPAYPVAHLTGTAKLALTPEQLAELKAYTDAGGTLLIDAAAGNSEFATSIESTLTTLGKLDVLPDNNLMLKDLRFEYRPYARKIVGSLGLPRLRAIMLNNRPAIVYSSLDLSTGLVGQPVDGINGYAPNTATDIVRRIVISVLSR